jgi:hypothetical protein
MFTLKPKYLAVDVIPIKHPDVCVKWILNIVIASFNFGHNVFVMYVSDM